MGSLFEKENYYLCFRRAGRKTVGNVIARKKWSI